MASHETPQTERPEPVLEQVARASLQELGDIRIDDVLLSIDQGLERMPSYTDLYRRWERQQWAVSDLDFTTDRELWDQSTDLDRMAILWSRRQFFYGEERVTAALAPFVWAAPTPEIGLFLSTQVADEARHTVFFERWWRAVVGNDRSSLAELLELVRPEPNDGYDRLFLDLLPAVAQRMASNPRDVDAFIEGITIYHIVIEATLALTGQRFDLELLREAGQSHTGFYLGFTAVARDESRHVTFGTKVLRGAVQEHAERFAPLIQRTVVECLPLISIAMEAPDPQYLTAYGQSQEQFEDFAIKSLNKRLRSIGISLGA
jgi:ribonucleoside-diphosphate reductase beta chain